MKKTTLILPLLITFSTLSAQVSIGKNAVNGNNTILDFYEDSTNVKGLILSTVDILPTTPANGTFLFDKTDDKVKMYENSTWVNLSDQGTENNIVANTSSDNGDGVIIGAEQSAASGVLILEADDKAIILPKITKPEENVPTPYPGMICYDTASKTMAVYDGKNWNYWK